MFVPSFASTMSTAIKKVDMGRKSISIFTAIIIIILVRPRCLALSVAVVGNSAYG